MYKFPDYNKSFAKITVKSAVNPLLWAIGLIALPLFVLSTITKNNSLAIGMFVVASLIVITFIYSYCRFLHINPDYLRSEEYQLKAQSLKLLGDKDHPAEVNVSAIVTVVTNPSLPTPIEQKIENEQQ